MHPSAASIMKLHSGFERLEFLGDRILNFALSVILLERYPDEQHGTISMKLALLSSRRTCSKIVESVRKLDKLLLYAGMLIDSEGADTIRADSIEALI